MTFVSDASPLISLARIGQLDLLHQLFGELIIPEAVWHEVVVKGAGQAGADEVKGTSWIKTQAIANKPLAQALQAEHILIYSDGSEFSCPSAIGPLSCFNL